MAVDAVIGGYEPAIWTVLRVRPVMEAGLGRVPHRGLWKKRK